MSAEVTGSEMQQFLEGDPLNPNSEKEDAAPKRTCYESCNYVCRNITVEPTMALFVLPAILTILTTQNLSLEKACRVNLNFTDEICRSLKLQQVDTQNEYEKATQQLLTKFLASRTYITATIPCLIALFAGSYSDKTGRRKIFLLMPIFGQILVVSNNMLNVYFFYELNLEFLTFSEAIFEGFSGGWTVAFFTMFAFISDITTEKNRTFRMGLLNFALTVGFPIGMGLSGVLLKNFGYYGCYGVAFGCHALNFSYNAFILKEPEKTLAQKKFQHENKGVCNFFRTFFSLANIRESWNVVFRSGPNHRRVRMIVYMLVIATLFGPMYGEISVLYLNTRYRFNWDEVKFSVFQTYNFVMHTVGTMFSIIVFSKVLGWHDSLLGIISTVSKLFSSFVYCFAPNGKIFFIAPLVEILNGTSLLAMRSIVSKFVDSNELGKVNSIISLTENLMPLVYVPLYTNVYKATMEVLPGAVFLMGAALTFPAVIVFIWLLYEHRKGVRRLKTEEADELPTKDNLLQPN
ncbi:proton-coupled folate transporter-like isoform X1 [Pectinophora gossypiella]|uniref:proton-coupled folate transporter-like isoform X1 n=1 Tax=Pectinophora gossypiella TaxID=13191 RepID=UPI00214EBFF2|nr:proton-coupled folate transporter-like isoform X1 [Pectinophora gossypiella]